MGLVELEIKTIRPGGKWQVHRPCKENRPCKEKFMPAFRKSRARAAKRKGGDDVLMSLLGPAPDNSRLASVSDDRILSTMAERILAMPTGENHAPETIREYTGG